jgi:tetratricopeptide (TPR) repeat protein
VSRRRKQRRARGSSGNGRALEQRVGSGASAPRGTSSQGSRRSARLALVLIGALLAAMGVFALGRHRAMRPVAFPPPRERITPAVSRADFVGAAACAGCHAEQFAAWRRSTHARAGGPPSVGNVIAPFDGQPIRFRDATVTPRVTSRGSYVFDVARAGEPVVALTVGAVIGGGHMAGGGTQGFVTRRPDGTWRFLPFDYSRDLRRWFCNTETRADKGWQPITPEMPLGACGDWPPVRVLGDTPRFANCQGCHAGQIEVVFDAASAGYATHVTTFAINCESCHGPARRHVELARAAGLGASADVGLAALALADKDASSRVCYQCHAVKDQLRRGFLAGDSVERYYSLAFPLLGDSPLFPDGRVRTFAYQESQRFSDCYLNGGMRCADCHDPHSQGYRDVNGNALRGRLSDGQCLACHPSKAERVEQHTRHPAASPGSRCVACHMPYLQQPQIGAAIRYARSDHSISIPRPALDSAIGVATACASCHSGRSPAVLQAQVERWYGTIKPLAPAVAAQLYRADDARALLASANGHTLAQFAGLARLFEHWVDEEHSRPDPAVLRELRALAGHPDTDVRALALATLHWLRGDDRGTRRLLARAMGEAGDRDAALRDRWSLALGWVGDRLVERGKPDAALVAYRHALEVTPNHARLLLSLANAQRDAGRFAEAVATYRQSLSLDGAESLTYVNLGIALAAEGDTSGAVSAWETATRVNRFDALPHFNLANVRLLRGQLREAIESYRAALALEPALIAAYLNLARAYAVAGMVMDARRSVDAALAMEPGNEDARQLQRQVERLPGATPRGRRE